VTDISIRISATACALAREGSLVHHPGGDLMHVAIGQSVKAGSRRRVRASVEVWLAFLDWLRSQTETIPGDTYEEQRRAGALIRARRAIAKEFDRLAKHPAYRGIGIAGTSSLVLPAYRMGEGRWWPTPDMAAAAADGTTLVMKRAELVPVWRTVVGREFTEWTANPPGC